MRRCELLTEVLFKIHVSVMLCVVGGLILSLKEVFSFQTSANIYQSERR